MKLRKVSRTTLPSPLHPAVEAGLPVSTFTWWSGRGQRVGALLGLDGFEKPQHGRVFRQDCWRFVEAVLGRQLSALGTKRLDDFVLQKKHGQMHRRVALCISNVGIGALVYKQLHQVCIAVAGCHMELWDCYWVR